jgi:hypothetical protein
LIYKKIITPLTPCDNCKKTEVKKLKIPPYVRQKKNIDPKGYRVIKLNKKYEIKKNLVF